MTEIVISILLLLGAGLSLLGSFGILRFPDIYGRMHAATKSATLGVICIMVATFLYFLIFEKMVIGKLLLTIIFVFLTAPVVGYMVSKSAYNVNVKLSENSVRDDLGEDMKKAEQGLNKQSQQ